mgnify:CR=1 FL=1
MAYTADKPKNPETSEQLRARIPGWGADLDPADRPSVPREKYDPTFAGAWWDFPERQEEKQPRERSIEHKFLTPVFGTASPPKGVSGAIRRLAYRRYSEGRAAHWLLLVAADRVDAAGSTVASIFTRHPDNPIAETGVLGEAGHRPVASRKGNRVDVRHQALDPVIVAAPWIAAGGIAYALIRTARRRRS